MDTDDGWATVWAEMSDEGPRDRLRDYLWLAANGPNAHAGRIAQLLAAAERCGRVEIVDDARVGQES